MGRVSVLENQSLCPSESELGQSVTWATWVIQLFWSKNVKVGNTGYLGSRFRLRVLCLLGGVVSNAEPNSVAKDRTPLGF